ncbi:MAG: aldo/keto reductase [Rhodospirillales bacterium]|nr:aldo/keto reductase [Rhodospirillales bacterium]
MEYRYIGNSGLRVSTISLGTMNFGATTSEATARKIVDAARGQGVNFVDTADAYVGGASETILGKLIRKDRRDWVVATKVGQQDGPPERKRGLSKKWMMEAIDASLTRLRMDCVEIYYMHHVDWDTPLEESIEAMGEIIAGGKAQYWGFSNHRAWQVGELIRLCDNLGTPRPIIAQPMYNMVNRTPETDLLPACEYYGIGVVPYSPLARGVLTGKYGNRKKMPKNSRGGRGDASILNRDLKEESLQVVAKIETYLENRNMPVSDFAIRWLLNNGIVTSVIGGPRTLRQWNAYVRAAGMEFTAEDEAFVDTLVAPGHQATHGYTWPRYPVRGRRAIEG